MTATKNVSRGAAALALLRARWLLYVAIGAVAYLLPSVFGGGSLAYETLVLVAIFAIMAYGADFVLSYLGEVSLGHTLFFAAGAYITAIAATKWGFSTLATLGASLVLTVVLALIVGLFTLRTSAFVFSLVTYGSAFIALTVVANTPFLGGTDGIVSIPPMELPAFGGSYVALTPEQIWPIAFACLALVVFFVSRFRRSRLGVSATMVQSNRPLAASLGIDAGRTRLMVFVISAPVSAIAGWLYAYLRSYVSLNLFEPYFLLLMLTAIILPGRRQLLGPIIGTAILVLQQQLFSLGAHGDDIVLGIVLTVVLVLWPGGLAGIATSIRERLAERRRRAAEEGPVRGDAPDHEQELAEVRE
ncbi:branched-chain amino acid ABC transporter permease [Agrococcus sp. BE272]|uniref:branched-chain amino acid ABC transporter permease n=1 Tax=Agrococcus sp. BE272 TaxID=2817727 RepID=UPI002866B87E|nr:branched-chain amino acid ABC transporter permease [Agrococcus sp. BE272]MDR7233576.1 branched-chain amino acid transport system permease protein [Agrococcus sp. BE272]